MLNPVISERPTFIQPRTNFVWPALSQRSRPDHTSYRTYASPRRASHPHGRFEKRIGRADEELVELVCRVHGEQAEWQEVAAMRRLAGSIIGNTDPTRLGSAAR
jgi:hypothetical protein